MSDYIVEPIKTSRPLADIIREAVEAGIPDDEIRAAVAQRKAKEPPPEYKPSPGRRGDELFQPDPSPSGVVKQGNRVAAPEVKDEGGDVDLGRYGRGPAAAGANMVSGTSFPGAPAANGPAEARGFMRFAAGGLGGMAAGGLARAAGAGPTVQAAAGGAASGALPAAMEGRPAMEVAKEAAISGAVPTVGGLLTGAGKAVMASRGAAARRLIEGVGGKVGVKDSGSGLPEFEGKGHISDADIGESARVAGKALLAENDKRFDENGQQPYNAEMARIAATREGRNLVDATPVRGEMLDLANNKRLQPQVRERIRSDIMTFDKEHGAMKGKWVMTEGELNDYRAQFYDRAKFDSRNGQPGSPEWAKVGDSFKRLVDKGPYADANQTYRTAVNESGDFREAIGAKRSPSSDENIDERRVANALARRGQSTTTAGIQGGDKRLEALLADNQELARIAASPELLRAKADLQPGIPMHGGLIPRVGIHSAIVHNINPLTGRVLYNPARAAIPAGQALSGAGQNAPMFGGFLGAVDYKRQHDAAVINTIFGKQQQQGESDNAKE